jgi:predicted phosphatase
MKYINSWNSNAKKWDIIDINLRLGKISFIKIHIDILKKKFILTLLNFTVKN